MKHVCVKMWANTPSGQYAIGYRGRLDWEAVVERGQQREARSRPHAHHSRLSRGALPKSGHTRTFLRTYTPFALRLLVRASGRSLAPFLRAHSPSVFWALRPGSQQLWNTKV